MTKFLRLLPVFLLCCAYAPNAYAQKQAALKKAAAALRPARAQTAAKTAARTGAVLARKTATARKAALKNRAERAVFLLLSDESSLQGTGFVIEEIFEGKSFLWGVTASHLLDLFDSRPYLRFTVNGRPIFMEAGKILRGSRDGADIALLQLPPEAARTVLPLSVAPSRPRRGGPTHSAGYARGSFVESPLRTVLEANSGRIVTSYAFYSGPRGGYCGSPLFNASDEVVGVHCGSFLQNAAAPAWKQDLGRAGKKLPDLSVAVPIEWARQLLAEYRTQSGGIPLRFKNMDLGILTPRQHLLSVTPVTGKSLRKGLSAGPYTDPAHLERGLNLTGADGVLVTLYDPGKRCGEAQIIEVFVNLKTKTVRRAVRPANAAREERLP